MNRIFKQTQSIDSFCVVSREVKFISSTKVLELLDFSSPVLDIIFIVIGYGQVKGSIINKRKQYY